MHNTIIETSMVKICVAAKEANRIARFVGYYHEIVDSHIHDDLQKDSSSSGGHGLTNKSASLNVVCDELYVVCDEL
jgi:hypothetical protein